VADRLKADAEQMNIEKENQITKEIEQ